MKYQLDTSISPEQLLLNNINKTYKQSYTFKEVKFSEHGVDVADKHEKNSSIVLVALPGAGFSGFRRYYYNRIDLSKHYKGRHLKAPKGTASTDDLLDECLAQLGLNLSKRHVYGDVMTNDSKHTKLRISPRCVMYTGSIDIVNYSSLEERVKKIILEGFDLPKSK